MASTDPEANATPTAGPGASPDDRRGAFGTLVSRPITMAVLFVMLLVIGTIAYMSVPLRAMPTGLTEPGLEVVAFNPGASAQENEAKVTRVLEEQIRTLPGVRGIFSGSNEDSVWVYVRFSSDANMDLAKAEVRDRVERARAQLPDTVREIGIYSNSMDEMPVMFFGILHPGDSARTDFLIDNVIKRRIEAVEGVGKIDVWGVLDDSIRIELDEQRVNAAMLDLGALISRMSSDNFALPLGEVTDGGRRILLRSDMRFGSTEEIESYPIGNGLTIGDIGHVERAKSIRDSLFKVDGFYSYYGEVQKDSQANVVATCKRLMTALDELEKDPRLEGEFKFLPFWNQGQFIESSLDQLRKTALTGGGLAVVILFLFLRRVRLTLCVALSIPVSILLAIAWVYFTGGSFNVLTMCGITLAMGMLVDNSVVVIENVSRHRDLGLDGRAAAVRGVREVALAVLLSTLTTVVVFLPLIFMSENPLLRIMFAALGLPLCVSLLISLAIALLFLPVAGARVVGPRYAWTEKIAALIAPIAAVPVRLFARVLGTLRWLLHGTVVAMFKVQRLLLRVLTPLRWLLALGVVALLGWKLRAALETLPLQERFARIMGSGVDELTPNQVLPYALPAVLAAVVLLFGLPRWRRRSPRQPERPDHWVPRGNSFLAMMIASNRRLIAWTMDHRLLAFGLALLALGSIAIPRENMTVAAFGQDENRARMRVRIDLEDNFTLEEAEQELNYYADWFDDRRESYGFAHLGMRFSITGGRADLYWENNLTKKRFQEIQREIDDTLEPKPGHRLRLEGEEGGEERSKSMVVFRLQGPNSEELERYGQEAVQILEGIPGLSSISSPLESSPQQVRVVFDSDLAQSFGVSPMAALQSISWALAGFRLPRFQEDGREIPLIIEYDEEEVAGLATLRDLEIFTEDGARPLSSFADLEFGRGSRSIFRRNGQVSFQITARVDDPLRQRELSDAGYAALRDMNLPRGYAVGEEDLVSTRQEEEMKDIQLALLLSVVLVFLLMGILFESFMLPFSVLFTIPFAITGAFWALYLTNTTMDSVGWIGIIILVGVVVNNGIVLMDRIHRLRGEYPDRRDAVIEGCAQRVRPILMTALTTVIGLLPMAMSEPTGEGIDYRALATCVAGGLAFSTFFTLWVVPLAYTLFDDLRANVGTNVRLGLQALGSRRGGKLAPAHVEARAD